MAEVYPELDMRGVGCDQKRRSQSEKIEIEEEGVEITSDEPMIAMNTPEPQERDEISVFDLGFFQVEFVQSQQ